MTSQPTKEGMRELVTEFGDKYCTFLDLASHVPIRERQEHAKTAHAALLSAIDSILDERESRHTEAIESHRRIVELESREGQKWYDTAVEQRLEIQRLKSQLSTAEQETPGVVTVPIGGIFGLRAFRIELANCVKSLRSYETGPIGRHIAEVLESSLLKDIDGWLARREGVST
jgi:hypothetical protein